MSPGGENIGGMNVSIDADYSPLAAAYSTAQSMSETAGTDIANALADGAAAGADVGKQIADSLAPITPAADDAAAAIGNFASQAASTVGQDESLAEATIRISGAFPDVTDGAGGAASALDGLAGSAGDAGGAVGGAGDAMPAAAAGAREVASGAQEAEGGLSGMAEQLLAVGEALAITDGMKEFGTAALEASDNVTRASIALTTITGSASKAEEILQGLDALGMQDGLSLPALQTAATRMQQLLGPGADVVSLLSTIANGAASMGSDLNSAANMFTNMAANGMVMSRSIGELGITMQDLANAVNQVNPQLDATSTNLTKLFKTMDQSDRITALQIAFQGLGGVAQQVAEQTFGGQWQQLANAWEQVMVQVGQALLPVISDLLDFTKTDIVPWIESAAAAFNELPGPVKDLAVGLAIATAALVPLTGALAAAGFAVTGLQALLPAVTGLVALFGTTAATAAVEETTEAAATTAMGAAATAATPGITTATAATAGLGEASVVSEASVGVLQLTGIGLAAALGVTLVSGLAAAGFGFFDLNNSIKSAQASTGLMTQTDIAGWLQRANDGLKTAAISSDDLQAAAARLKTGMDNGVISAQQYATAMDSVNAAMKRIAVEGMESVADGWAPFNSGLNLSTAGLRAMFGMAPDSNAFTAALIGGFKSVEDQVARNTAAYHSAQVSYQMLSASFASGKPMIDGVVASAAMVAVGLADLKKAASDLGVTIGPLPGSMDAITTASNALSLQTGTLVDQTEMAGIKTQVETDALTLAEQAYTASAIKVQALASQVHDFTAAQDGSATMAQHLADVQQSLVTAYDASAKAYTTLTTAATDYTAAVQASIVPQAAQLVALDNLTNALGPVASAFTGVTGDIDTLRASMPNFGVIMTSLSSGPLAGLQSALAEASAKVDTLAAKMATGANVGQQYEQALTKQLAAQIALDQEQAVAATGLQGVTDATSLATVAVAAAQAKYNDMVTAYQAGLATYAQMQAAISGLKSAQDALNTAQGSGISLADQLGIADGQVATAANTATGALNAQAAAATAAASAMGSLSAADAAAAAASDNASTTSGMLADNPGGIASIGVGSAPSGYVLQSGSLAGHESVNAVLAPGYTTDYAGSGATGSWFWSTFLPTAVTFAQALQLNVAAAEKAAAAQYSGTDPFSLDEATLASAQADLQTLTKSYTAGNQAGITPAQIQSAQTAVATAQAALNALSGTSATTTTSTSTSGGTSTASSLAQALQALQVADAEYNAAEASGNAGAIATAQAAVDAANTAYVNAGGYTGPGAGTSTGATGVDNPLLPQPASVGTTDTTGTTTTSTTGTTGTTATTSVGSTTSGGTAANDGGSYPAVTAHQSSAEVWNVAMGTATSDTTSATSSAVTAAASSTDAATASQAASTAASSAVNATGYIASTLATTADTLAATIAGLDTIAANTNPKGSATPINLSTGAVTGSLPTSQVGGTESGSIGGALNYWTPPPVTTVGAPLTAADITALIAQGEADFISNFGQGVGSVGEQSQLGYLSSLGVSMTQLQALVVQAQNSYAQQQSAISAQLQIVENQYINAVEGGASPAAIAALAAQLQTQYGMSQGQIGALVPPSNAPTPGAAVYPGSVAPSMAGGGMNVHIDFTGANFSGANPATISNAVQAGMQQALVNTLRAQGARF